MKRTRQNSKRIIAFIGKLSLVLACLAIQGFRPSPSSTFNLTVRITNLEHTRGVVEIGLYDKGDNWPTPGKTYKMARPTISGNTATYVFKNLPNGDYAIASYHDENGDGCCNKNLIGVPTEAFAFSNNVRPFLSAPSFKACRFWVTEERGLTIKMVY